MGLKDTVGRNVAGVQDDGLAPIEEIHNGCKYFLMGTSIKIGC